MRGAGASDSFHPRPVLHLCVGNPGIKALAFLEAFQLDLRLGPFIDPTGQMCYDLSHTNRSPITMAELSQPHDLFFKEVFSRPEVAQDFLRHYLPAAVVAHLEPASLELQKGSFVDPELQEYFSDLLYRVQLKDGESAYVYLLFEHKSYPEPLIAFQLLRYLLRIWEQDLRHSGRRQLVPIIPLVVYHGRAQWNVALNLGALFAGPEALRLYLPEFQYQLCDVTAYSEAELKGAVLLRVTLLVLKYVFSEEMADRLSDIMTLLSALTDRETALEYLETLLRYLSAAAGTITEQDVREAVTTAFSETGGATMTTIAEKWVEQGRQEGLQEGLQQGRQEGAREGLLAGIELGLELKFGSEGVRLLPEIRKIEDVDVLQAIHEGLKTVDTPDELRRIYR